MTLLTASFSTEFKSNASSQESSNAATKPRRYAALDAYRGFIALLLASVPMASGLRISKITPMESCRELVRSRSLAGEQCFGT